MTTLTGVGNDGDGSPADEIAIYIDKYPPGCQPTAIMITREGGTADSDIRLQDNAMIRIWSRDADFLKARTVMDRIDQLLHHLVLKDIDDYVRVCSCQRNSGPQRQDSESNDLERVHCLYDVIAVPNPESL